jgi:hypothetical protein
MFMAMLVLLLVIALWIIVYVIPKFVQRWSFTPYERVSPPSDVPDRTRLNILQMNVFWRPRLLHLLKNEYVAERSLLLADCLSEFDFACLHETFHFGSSVV